MAKKKSAIAGRIKNNPEFERTRENMSEFGRAGKAGKLLRRAFRELLIYSSDNEVSQRLTTICKDILNTDRVNGRGERTVGKGEHGLLRNFNFNQRIEFAATFHPRQKTRVDRASGEVIVSIPEFVPKDMIKSPLKTTHFVLRAAAIAIDFDEALYDHALVNTGDLELNHTPLPAFDMQLQLPPNSNRTILVALCVEFFQLINNRRYILKSDEFNTASVIDVNNPVVSQEPVVVSQ